MSNLASFSGVVPSLAQVAELGPPRSEIGVGILMPWAGKMYVLNYNSHKRDTGRGVSLRCIEDDMTMQVVPETKGVDGTYTNRFLHHETNQIIVGPHLIDDQHNIRTVPELEYIRTCGTTWHLTDPENLVYVLGMEGELFELNVRTLECTQVCGEFRRYATVEVGADGYACHAFPAGVSAHWVRLRSNTACKATAQFVYT